MSDANVSIGSQSSENEYDEDDDDIQIIDIQSVLNNPQQPPNPDPEKKFNQMECPVCFDNIKKATVTPCGHVFCLECLQQSISSSTARGQIRGKSGVGLCPLCRKKVIFKDSILLRMKIAVSTELPKLPPT